jgi:hypothetical protein
VSRRRDPHALPSAGRLDAERGADAARREAAGVAVREHGAPLFEQIGAEAADTLVGLDLVAVDATASLRACRVAVVADAVRPGAG